MMIPALMLMLATPTAQAGDKDSPVPAPQPYGLVQAWLTAYDMDEDEVADPAGYGDPEDDPGLKLRRARIGFEGRGKGVKYGVIFGMSAPYDAVSEAAGSTEGDLVDAYGGVRPVKGLWLTAGVQKVPVFREMLMGAQHLSFTERSVSTSWMAPGRDAGVIADYRSKEEDDTHLRLRVGAFNGNGSALGDDNAGKLVAARAEFNYGPGAVYRTYGDVKGLTIGVAGDFWMDQGPAVKTVGYGGDAIIRVSGLTLMLDGHFSTIEPVDSPVELPGVLAETGRFGGFAQVGYAIDAWEPVVRLSTFDDDTDAENNGDVAEGTFGVVWHSDADVIRAGAGYALRLEREGQAAENDTARLWMQLKL